MKQININPVILGPHNSPTVQFFNCSGRDETQYSIMMQRKTCVLFQATDGASYKDRQTNDNERTGNGKKGEHP